MQLFVMDRLIEAKPRAINNYIFNFVTHEHSTKLMADEDLLPVDRGTRKGMTDEIARPIPRPSGHGGSVAGTHPESTSTEAAAQLKGLPTSAEVRSTYYQSKATGDPTREGLITSLPGAKHDSGRVNIFMKPPMQALNVSGNGTCHQRRAPATAP
jgi:hypothetical protein